MHWDALKGAYGAYRGGGRLALSPPPRARPLAVCEPVRGIEWAPESAVEFNGPVKPSCLADTAGNKPVAPDATKDSILAQRRQRVGPNLALFFQEDPLHIVRGRGCELFDAEVRQTTDPWATALRCPLARNSRAWNCCCTVQGNSYLDCINNVSHVGE